MTDLQFAVTATAWTPHNYQTDAIKFLLEHAGAGLFLDPGLGKTSVVLGAIKILKRKGLLDRVLIIAPLRVCYSVWPGEIEKWLDFNELTIEILHGPNKDKALRRKADIYIINPEGLEWLVSEGRAKDLGADTLVIDESSGFKHTKTRRFKNLKPLLKAFRRRWILTGTPVPNGLLDLFGQMYIVDQGNALGSYITHYKATYFTPTGFGNFTWVLKPGAEDQIYEKIRPLTLRLDAKDLLELPERVSISVPIKLSPAVRKVYDELEAVLFSELENGELVLAMSAAAASNKCRQVANGGVYYLENTSGNDDTPEMKRTWKKLHDEKTNAVVDLIQELNGKPVLVAYDFGHDLERLLQALGPDTPRLGGGVSPQKSKAIERAWNAGEIPVLLAHPKAMGHGLNLQGAGNHIIWHSPTWDLELHDQFIKRVERQGNKASHVFVYYVIASDTVDEVVMKAIARKGKVQTRLLDALKDYRSNKIVKSPKKTLA